MIIAPFCANDLDNIYSYITNTISNPIAAENLMDAVQSSFERVCEFPYSCEEVRDGYLKSKGYRKLIINNYVALYRIDEAQKSVIFLRTFYGRQNYEELI